MKIALVAHLSEISGAGIALLEIAKGLNSDRFECRLILPGNGPLMERAIAEGIRPLVVPNVEASAVESGLLAIPKVLQSRLCYVKGLTTLLRRERFDLAYINSTASIFGGIAAQMAAVPIVWHSHETISHAGRSTALKLAFIRRASSAVIYASKTARDTFPVKPDTPWIIARNFTDVAKLAADAAAKNWPRLAPGEPIRFLANGLFHRKGADILLDAVIRAKLQTPELNIRVIIAGSAAGQDVEYIKNLKKQCTHPLLQGQISFPGAIPNLVSLMTECHAFISPSRNEACPISLVEALALGLPVITTNTGQCADLVGLGSGGLVVSVEDPDALAAAITQVASDYGAAVTRAKVGQQHILQLYNKADFFSDIEELLTRIVEERKPG